jgi:hypothetical protein
MAALSWEEIVERGKQHNKTVICEVERSSQRYFKVKCDICITEKESQLGGFKSCLTCSSNKRRCSLVEFISKAKSTHGDKYNYILVEYLNCRTKIKILCNQCNNVFTQSPNSHLTGAGCRHCKYGEKRLSQEEFILKAKNKHVNKYNYDLVEYITILIKVKILCNQCKKVFSQTPNNHTNGAGCPNCYESKGENRVAKYLSEKNILFKKNKIFKTLKDKRYLKPDFYLEHFNLLIEYDGEFHYKALIGSTPEIKQKNLEIQQKRDKIKTEWAKANNIPLLRIPYWDYDRIEELIEAFILQHTKKKEIKQLVLEM